MANPSALIVVKRLAHEDLMVEIRVHGGDSDGAVQTDQLRHVYLKRITGLSLPRSFERHFLIFSACTEQITSCFSPAHLSEM